jgi:hypothetical protein
MPTNNPRGPSRGPRGRPFLRNGHHTAVPGATARVAWLLRVNRLLGQNEEWVRTSTFAAAFKGGTHPTSASESTVSRWETGVARATFTAIRRYEELLELPSGTVIAPADALYRYAAPTGRAAPTLARPGSRDPSEVPYRRVEELLDRAAQDDVMTGDDWDELTGHLAARPETVLVPSRLWTDLSERLLAEMMVADGLRWMRRSEALHRLMAHPVGQTAAVAACATAIADPTNNVFIEPMVVLDASLHADANRLVLNQLTRPTNSRTRYGALLACVRKVRDGHFSSEQLATIATAIGEIITGGDVHPATVALAVDVLRRLPGPLRAGANRGLHGILAADRMLSEVMSAGRLAPSGSSRLVVDRIVRATTAEAIREPPGFIDDLLPILVDEMLFSPVLDTALMSALLVRSTPYAPALASALATDLATPRVVGDGPLASAMLGTLRTVGRAQQRPLVERLVLAPGLRPEVTYAAISCLAHVGGRSTDQYWAEALARHSRAWRHHRNRQSAEALTTLVYGLGIARNFGMLSRVRADETAPRPARDAAAWWLGQPASRYASVNA